MAHQQLPAIVNLVVNPSAEVNTTGMPAGTNATLARDTSWGWAGTATYRLTATSAATSCYGQTSTTQPSPYVIPAVPGDLGSCGARAMTALSGMRARACILFRTSGNTTISTLNGAWVNLTPNVPALVKIEGQTAPANTVYAIARIEFGLQTGAALTIGNVFYFDALHYSPTAELPAYVDGSLGAYHGWLGTAHLSTSYREAIEYQQTRQRRGISHVRAELWRVTRDNQLIEDITPATLAGKITTNVHNAVKSTLALSQFDRQLTAYTDYVAPFIITEDAEGYTTRVQHGVYAVSPAGRATHTEQYSQYTLEARDLSWLVSLSGPTVPYTVSTGANPVAMAASILTTLGFRHAIPASTATLANPITWVTSPQTSWLTIVNDLLMAAGYYTLWANRFGVLVSRPYFELASSQPALQFYVGDDSVVVGAIEQEAVTDTVANQVIIFKDDATAPIRAVATNDSPLSPSSTVNMGGQIIQRIITPTELASQTVADAMALAYLEESASYTNKLKLLTFPLAERELHEVVELAIYNDVGKPLGFGLWWCDGYELPLGDRVEPMVWQLKRVEAYRA